MFKHYTIGFIGLLGVLLTACENPANFKFDQEPARLVIVSNFTTDQGFHVQVSKSRSPLDNGPTEYINNAKVEIWEGETLKEYLYPANTRSDEAPYYAGSSIQPKIGEVYTIRVEAPGFEPVTAKSAIPERVNLSCLRVENFVENPEGTEGLIRYNMNLRLCFNDPPKEKNYYHINIYQRNYQFFREGMDTVLGREISRKLSFQGVKDNAYIANYDGGLLVEDTGRDGLSLEIQVPLNVLVDSKMEILGDIFVELRSVSAEYYLFLSSLSRQRSNREFPFAEPVTLFNNITNGQGVFAGYSQTAGQIGIRPR
jgi:Domain of unknown function (DUF4249)